MANIIFPPVINYTQDFVPNDMKMSQLERTLAGRKINSYILQYTGDSVGMLLTVARFVDAMQTQSIKPNAWEDQFGYTLHGDPSDLWDKVLNNRDNNGVKFDRDEAGFNLSIEFYVMKYVADPNARDTQIQTFNGGSFCFFRHSNRRCGKAHPTDQDSLLLLTQVTRRRSNNGRTD